MVAYQKFNEALINRGFDKSIVNKLIEEYRITKKARFLNDHEKAILHSAKVSDLVLALIKQDSTGKILDVNNIHFGALFNELIKLPKPTPEDVILTLAIPRVAQSVCTIRSKTNVAHVKTIDPNFIDSFYSVCACDWMISELVSLFYDSNPDEASELINSIIRKEIPDIEEFEDGSVVILRRNLSTKNQVLLLLYNFYPKRLSALEVNNSIKSSNIYAYFAILLDDKLIHKSKDGYKLTRLGIDFIEKNILSD